MRCTKPNAMRFGVCTYRRNVLLTAVLTGVVLASTMPARSTLAQDKPSVVIMLAENVGYCDIGAYGAGEVRGMPTPNIDRIAAEGLRLTQYLVEPGCTPSRAALMTGRYSTRSGLSTIIVGGTPYLKLIGDYQKTLEKYPNPKAVNMTQFGR